MQTQLPYWLQVMQALLTPAIALLAVVIGTLQWRTTHQRAVQDLFEKRWENYMSIREVLGEIIRHGSITDQNFYSYLRAVDTAQFLFGPDLSNYLNKLNGQLAEHQLAEKMAQAEGPNRDSWVDRQFRAFEEIAKFYDIIHPLILPYLRMHQKAPRF